MDLDLAALWPRCLAYDAFDDANSTALGSHPMVQGRGWTVQAGTFDIQSSRANTASVTGGIAIATTPVVSANVRIRALTQIVSTATAGLCARFTNTSNLWFARYNTTNLSIFEVNAGTTTSRASGTISATAGLDYWLELICNGTTLTAIWNNTAMISYDSAALNLMTATHGLRSGTLAGALYDNFEIIPL